MIPNLMPNTTYAIHLRANSVSGGKDWIGTITANGDFWGRTGQVNQHAAKPGDRNALLRIINQKQGGKDRYIQVDEYLKQSGWKSQQNQQSAASSSKPAPAPTKPSVIVELNDAPADSIQWDF